MLLIKLIKILEKICYQDKRDPPEFYGIQVGSMRNLEQKIIKKGVLVAIEPSFDVINYARQNKYNVIITKDPLIFSDSTKIDDSKMGKLLLLLQEHITLFVINSSFDNCPYGITESLVSVLAFPISELFYYSQSNSSREIPIGRICIPPSNIIDFEFLISDIKRKLNITKIKYMKSLNKTNSISKILVIPGSFSDRLLIIKAYEKECDCVICGDMTYNCYSLASDYNISIIELSYLESIKPGMMRLKKIISTECPQIIVDFYDTKNIIEYT